MSYIVTYRLHVVLQHTASMSFCNLPPPCRTITYRLHVVLREVPGEAGEYEAGRRTESQVWYVAHWVACVQFG
jgi:hypothetical protein